MPEQMNRAAAGVGMPMKDSACLSSTLNLARRRAEQSTISKGHSEMTEIYPCTGSRILYRIIAGASPKLVRSAKESSSLPIAEYAFRSLAANPSQKSKTAAASMSIMAVLYSCWKAANTETVPHSRFRHVIALGMCFIMSEGLL